jgi:hypothetical protein
MKRTISVIFTALAFAAFLSGCTFKGGDGMVNIYEATEYVLFDEYKIGGPDG